MPLPPDATTPSDENTALPEAIAADEAQVVDFDPLCIAEMDASLDRSGTLEILQALVEDAPGQRQAIEQAIETSDRRSLQRHAHTIKGTLRLLKAPALAERFGECELALAEGGEVATQALPMQSGFARYERLLAAASAAVSMTPPTGGHHP